jgi:hypothetical protein
MSPPFLRRRAKEPPPPTERPEVRQYRYLLRTAPPERLEVVHRRALEALDPVVRASILRTAQDRLLSGRDLTVDDTPRLAVLITQGELRTPGILLAGLTDLALTRLAHMVVVTTEAPDLWAGYDAWDGLDPEQPVVAVPSPTRAVLQQA